MTTTRRRARPGPPRAAANSQWCPGPVCPHRGPTRRPEGVLTRRALDGPHR